MSCITPSDHTSTTKAPTNGAQTSIVRFLEELAYQRGASRHTIAAYRRDLNGLLAWAENDARYIAHDQLRRRVMQLHGAGLATRSIARKISAWRAWFRWLQKRREIQTNPCEGLSAPKRSKNLPSALNVEQTMALMNTPVKSAIDQRDLAMFELFYSSGLRLSELAALNASGGLDLENGEVTVVGKRNKTRLVPVGKKALTALRAWLCVRIQVTRPEEPALFTNQRGQRLSPRSIERRLDAWAKRTGSPVHVHPHMLRHSCASHLLQSSGDLRAVQEMLGHASIGSTQVYTHLDFQHLAKVYDTAHPRAHAPAPAPAPAETTTVPTG